MIRKFSITNSTQLLSEDDEQRLEALSKKNQVLQQHAGIESTDSSPQDAAERTQDNCSDLQCTSTRSTDTGCSKLNHTTVAGDYEELYTPQSYRVSIDGKFMCFKRRLGAGIIAVGCYISLNKFSSYTTYVNLYTFQIS